MHTDTDTELRERDGVSLYVFLMALSFEGEKPQFPDGGKMSQFLDTVSIGQEIEISGPFGLIEYTGAGRITGLSLSLSLSFLFLIIFAVARKEKPIMKHIGMIGRQHTLSSF